MPKATILFPIGSFYPAQSGGPSNTVYWHTKALKQHGIQPIVITTSVDTANKVATDTWLQLDCGEVIYTSTRIHYLPLRLMLQVFRRIKEVDIVHLTALFYPASWLSACLARWYGKQVVWSVRGELAPSALKFSPGIKQLVLTIIRQLVRRHHVVFHVTSAAESSYVREQMGAEVKIIHLPNLIELPAKLVRQSVEPYLLFLGRLHPIKAIDKLITALIQSPTFMTSNYVLVIAGNDKHTYAETLKGLVSKLKLVSKVRFIGRVEGEAKEQLLANAHCLILPSHTENFGNVVIEALAQSTPVIASRGTPWKILTDTKAGYWVNNTASEIATAIEEILTQPPQDYQEMRKRSYQLVSAHFEVKQNIQRWITSYRMLKMNGHKFTRKDG